MCVEWLFVWRYRANKYGADSVKCLRWSVLTVFNLAERQDYARVHKYNYNSVLYDILEVNTIVQYKIMLNSTYVNDIT